MAELWVCPEVLSFRWPLSGSQQKERVCASMGWEGQLQAECSVCPKDDGEGRGAGRSGRWGPTGLSRLLCKMSATLAFPQLLCNGDEIVTFRHS